MDALTLQLTDSTKLTDDQFYELCLINRDIKIERTASGELVLMPPTGGETRRRNSSLNAQLWMWNQQAKSGETFDSSTAFKLSNGANRSPDASWVTTERWNTLTAEQQENFPPICPDSVVELRSSSDRLPPLQQKMQEYIDSGTRLGWLLNCKAKQVEIYRPNQGIEVLEDPTSLSGEDVLPGFELKLAGIL